MSNPPSHTPNPLQPIAIHAAEGAADLLGPPPVITGEDPDAFLELLDRVRADAKPKGIIEDILVRDFVDLLWDIRRLRRLKASLLQAAAHKGVKAVLGPLVASWEVDSLADNWALRRPRAIAKVDKVLAAAGLTSDAVMAETLALRLDPIERIERMIASQEGRQEAVLREIDRHRAVLAEALRGATKEIEEAEFEEVQPRDVAA
jgi:hypothetical protein